MARMNNHEENQDEMIKMNELEREICNAILRVMHNTMQTFINLDALNGADRINMVTNILLNLIAGHMVGAYLHMEDETKDGQKIDKEEEIIKAITRFMVALVEKVKREIADMSIDKH